ncbi:hypothetical protein A0H81_10680 [Grifola frondosa]|uniref:Uncharacterized protein n=1 Tax=Grifola frondosa TaxID=5627 RepID=A0A1C7LXF9_GRIFR|nr:hypothetical protein A0H81_10680 [Grifola frondosa]
MDRGAEGFETGSFGLKNRAELRWEVPAAVKHPGMPSPLGVVVTTETFQQVDSEVGNISPLFFTH